MLKLGVELYEVSTQQLERSGQFRDLLKKARGRLHAKLALIDREWVMLGSMDLDPRSMLLNTEFGVRVRSFDLTQAPLYAYQLDDIKGVYRVVLEPDGENVQWIGTGDVNNEVLDSEPDSSMLGCSCCCSRGSYRRISCKSRRNRLAGAGRDHFLPVFDRESGGRIGFAARNRIVDLIEARAVFQRQSPGARYGQWNPIAKPDRPGVL